jgi:Tfp pilus assembly protein PilF
LSGWKSPNRLSTLAAAYAEAGDFPNAVQWMEKAIELDPSASGTLRSILEVFKAHKPYRAEGSALKGSLVLPSTRDVHF